VIKPIRVLLVKYSFFKGSVSVFSRNVKFDCIRHQNGIERRLMKVNRPRTNGQIERMNRMIKEATVKRYYYETHQ